MATPTMNGPPSHTGKYMDNVDTEDPEYQRQMRRPAEVKEDLTQMDNRARVKLILNSQAFREELEQIIETQLSSGNHPASLLALQQITDILLPHTRSNVGVMTTGHSSPVIPINDIRGVDALNYHKLEKTLRCKLASLYRVVDLHGWTSGIYNHITARIDQDHEHFLINPFGLLYSEVTAASLVKVDMQGQIVDGGSTPFGINLAGYTLHSAIHAARPDIKCVIHIHYPPVIAVSAMECGMLPVSQEAMSCGKISYHDFQGILVDEAEREQIARNLGPTNMVMVLRNHGIAACGRTIEEAFMYASLFTVACETQVRLQGVALDNLVVPSEEVQSRTFAVANQGGGGVQDQGTRKWRIGEIEFEALMRQLDNAGYRTGYTYRMPLIKYERKERSNSDVEIPPSATSFVHEDDIGRVVSPLKVALERQKQSYKAGWLNSPNVYTKKELEEIGTDTPKKITKWVADGGDHGGSAPIKVDKPNVFAPQGENPKEFKDKQKQIRKDYYEEKVSAGPQSRILDGVTYEEAERIRDGNLSGTADTVVTVGAASKGIIQRDHQHNVAMYKTTYAANPFENISEDDLKSYQRQVEGVTTTESDDLSPGPDGRLISTDERMLNIQQSTRIEGGDAPDPVATEINEPVALEVINGDLDVTDMAISVEQHPKDVSVNRAESARHPPRSRELIDELQQKNLSRSQSDRRTEKTSSPTKSTDSASADTLDDRSSKEGSPTKEQAPAVKDKDKTKKKKKFRIPSFSKKKKDKEPKEGKAEVKE